MRRIAIPTLLAALAVLAVGGAPAKAAAGMTVAIEDEDVFVNGISGVNPLIGYRMLDDLGIKTMRILITQTSVQTGSRFDFTKYRNFLVTARERGIQVQVVLVGKYPRPNVKSFAKFAQAAAAALKGQGVTFYSIWNEPNLKAWIRSNNRAAIYRSLYAAGYKAVKKGDRSAKVLFGETAPFIDRSPGTPPLKFLRQLACLNNSYRKIPGKRCPRLKANGYAHHPYDFTKAPKRSNRGRDNATIGTLRNLTRALSKIQRTRQITGISNVYLTEFGYFATGPRALPEDRRALYLQQGFAIARKTPHVKEMVQYLLAQPRRGRFTTGVVSDVGVQLPSFAALKASVQ
jgi:hypothetical protein